MYLFAEKIGRDWLVRRTTILSASVENGACLRPLVCVFLCMLLSFSECSGNFAFDVFLSPFQRSDDRSWTRTATTGCLECCITTNIITSTSYDPSSLPCIRSVPNQVRRYCLCKRLTREVSAIIYLCFIIFLLSDDSYLTVSSFRFVGMATSKLNREKLKKMMS